MAASDGMNDGRFVSCDHCTENVAAVCGHCGGDHHGPDCPTLRGVEAFTPEELEGIQERLSVTMTGVTELETSGDLIRQLVADYRSIHAALSPLGPWDEGVALAILRILYASGVKE